jgi:hypothetical protein
MCEFVDVLVEGELPSDLAVVAWQTWRRLIYSAPDALEAPEPR